MKIAFTVSLLLAWGLSQGKTNPDEEYSKYRSIYPDEPVIYLLKKEVVNYAIVGASIQTTITVHEEMMHLGENTSGYAGDKIYSSSFYEVSDIEAYTLVPGKRKYERIDIKEYKESYDKDTYVFYDDTKEVSFTYPAVQKGAKTVLKYTKTIKNPRLISLFFFDSYAPVHQSVYQIEYDPNIELNPQFFNTDNLEIAKKEKKKEDGRKLSTYSASRVPKVKYERSRPSYSHIAKAMYCPIATFKKSDGKQEEVISSVAGLHQWYRTFLNGLEVNNEALKTLVNTIINPDDPTLEKVRKIYYWVQANIKYIAFEDGMRGLIPHSGEYVVSKRYGDCKDMASAIVALLREAGIDANYTWIGSRDLPYRYSQTPSPITDNHMIATFTHEGRTYYLDATGQYTPLDLPTSMIQGKECLISLGPDDFIINEVPVISKEENVMTDSVNITLSNRQVKGAGQVTLTGYAKVFNTYRLIKSNQKNVENYVERLLSKGSNKFEIDTFSTHHVQDFSNPIKIDYSFSIPDYYREINGNIYINLILDKTMTDGLLENRKVAIENEYKYINRNIVRLKIPNGYSVSSLPKNDQNSDQNFGYKISYQVSDTEVVVTKEFYVDYLIMEPTDFGSWNKMIAEYAQACRKALVLTKTEDNLK